MEITSLLPAGSDSRVAGALSQILTIIRGTAHCVTHHKRVSHIFLTRYAFYVLQFGRL